MKRKKAATPNRMTTTHCAGDVGGVLEMCVERGGVLACADRGGGGAGRWGRWNIIVHARDGRTVTTSLLLNLALLILMANGMTKQP